MKTSIWKEEAEIFGFQDTTITITSNEHCRLTGRYQDAVKQINLGYGIDANFFNNGATSTDVQVCFAAGEKIWLADDTQKNIEEVLENDLVWAVPHDDPTGKPKPCRVVRVFKNVPQRCWQLKINDQSTGETQTIRVTSEHPFFVERKGWVQVKDLIIGDRFRTMAGEFTQTLVVKKQEDEAVPVYNFEVEEAHTYFVGESKEQSVLVHNDCSYCGAPGRFPHGILQYPVCPQKNSDILSKRGLNPLSAVDGIVTHENQHVPELVIGFCQAVPVASQLVDMDTLISDEKATIEKVFAGANLGMSVFAFFLGGGRLGGVVEAYDEVFHAGSVTRHARNASKTVDVVESSAQYAGRRTSNYAAGIPQGRGVFKSTQTGTTEGNVTILKKNLMVKASKADGDHAHHIVPSTSPMAQKARDILDRYHIDINSVDNGAILSKTNHYGQKLHSARGINEVTDRLKAGIVDGSFAKTRSNLIGILGDIGSEIKNGTFIF